VECTTFHLLKDQPKDDPKIGPKLVAAIIISYNLIKYKVAHDCIIHIILFLANIQHNGDVSLVNDKY
jgi:hypothetical protein